MVNKFHSVLHQSYLFTCASCLLSEYKLIGGGADRKDPPPAISLVILLNIGNTDH